MIKDDFSALDFLCTDSLPGLTKGKKKRKGKGASKRRLASLLPMVGRKAKQQESSLTGWGIPLSWPGRGQSSFTPFSFDAE